MVYLLQMCNCCIVEKFPANNGLWIENLILRRIFINVLLVKISVVYERVFS